ncbi:transposase [groundwater metagenome]
MEKIELIAKRYEKFSPIMDERMRRLWAGVESSVIGFGGIQMVSKATGLSRNTIVRGEQELEKIEEISQNIFRWDKIPDNDNIRLTEFLKQSLNIDWVDSAKIEKIDNGKTIRVYTDTNFISLRLNDEKTRVNLKIDDGRIYEFIAKMENDTLNIYMFQKGIREPGGGRKKEIDKNPKIKDDLSKLIDPVTRGHPESPLLWTCKSLRKLASELKLKGHKVSHRIVGNLLHEMGYSLQANQKNLEGSSHPDRNAQFEYINQQVINFQKEKQPVISVDTKKKEKIGNFKNNGQEWLPKGKPEEVEMHDFMKKELGRGIPYGVYDMLLNKGWVSVGTDNDTAEFAVETIRRWWKTMGILSYSNASKLMITADGGGSNGSRVKLWKVELQTLANETGMEISVSHFPPGTSKWNKIEHQLFSFITKNWRAKPLISHEVIVNLIANTTTEKGLKVMCELNTNKYATGIKISDEQLAEINIKRDDFHGEWNYTIYPKIGV